MVAPVIKRSLFFIVNLAVCVLQQIENKLITKFFVKALQSGAFTKNLGLV
jgi:hypothetical protein